MNYKTIIDTLKTTSNSHLMVETVGYGNLSDIEVPDNEEPPNYPYVFINPVSVAVNRNEFSVTVNLIGMTQVRDKEQNEIDGQDMMIAILTDIIARFGIDVSATYPLIDIQFPFSVTPFKERFQDDVVGATVSLTINYGKAIEGCEIAFA